MDNVVASPNCTQIGPSPWPSSWRKGGCSIIVVGLIFFTTIHTNYVSPLDADDAYVDSTRYQNDTDTAQCVAVDCRLAQIPNWPAS